MFKRYAIFDCPTGPLAKFSAAWLGWDNSNGQTVDHPKVDGTDVAALTKRPRKYGFHGTLKAPFHLASNCSLMELKNTAERFAARYAPIDVGSLTLCHQNGFIALRPDGSQPPLCNFTSDLVRHFDPLRAPLSDADIARRRKSRLTPKQDAQLLQWGYPYIFDDFHFHLTLTGYVKSTDAAAVMERLSHRISPLLPHPYTIEAITVVGEDADGMFHQVNRYPLIGQSGIAKP
jgi:hypothetical protein